MLYNGRRMGERPPIVVEDGALLQSLSALARDYLLGAPGVRPFYDGAAWDKGALLKACEKTLTLPRERKALAEALVAQQHSRGARESARAAGALLDPRATAVVTGQQAGLFGGPLYVLYKALAAVKVAALLEKERQAPVVPVFWVASEDHDFAEVRSATILDESGGLRTLRYDPLQEPTGQPASRVILDETIVGLSADLLRYLPEGLHRDETVRRLSETYRPGASLSGAFAGFLSGLIPGLVVLDPSDPKLKALMVPVFAREIQEASPTSRLASEVGERLLRAGYHQQVPVRPGLMNLFFYTGGERRALGVENGYVEVRGIGTKLKVAEALALLHAEPTPWSPGVLLRPLAQDHLVPTAGYIGGPAEVAYHAQIGPSYPHFGIPRPVLIPRPSVTLLESSWARALESEGLRLADLLQDPEALLTRWAREAYPEVEAAFAKARESLERAMDVVEETLGTLDPTLRGAAEAARGRALHQIQTLQEKATRALKKRDQSRGDRLRRTRDALFPGGAFQERGLALVSLLSRHGEGLIELVRERIDPFARGHQVISL
jgi:bacillithiol biosynthesis cysteine-adding enzyme BshC